MRSKKKSSSAFRTTFIVGATFLSILFIFIVLIIGGIVTSYLNKNSAEKKIGSEKAENLVITQHQVRVDTVYITEKIVEKCTKNHYEQKSSPQDSLLEKFQQDSTNK